MDKINEYVFFSECPAKFSESGDTEGVHEQPGRSISVSEQTGGTENVGKPTKVLKVSKRGGVRSRIKRYKKKSKISKFSIMGTNAAGLKAKKDSLIQNIQLFRPSVITIQETKFRKSGNMKLENSIPQ